MNQCNPLVTARKQMLFELDMTESQLPEHLAGQDIPLRFVCELGRHTLDLDVVDPEVNRKLRGCCYHPGNPDIPVGFQFLSLPVGTILRRIQ